MNIYYNAEYTGAHEDARLISMGFIAENGQGLYMEFADVPEFTINKYVRESIFPDTYFYDTSFSNIDAAIEAGGTACRDLGYDFKVVMQSTAAYELSQWFSELLKEYPEGESIQLVSYCCQYDACLLYNLFRGVVPSYLNLICYDILGIVMHHVTDWAVDMPFSARLRATLRDNKMEELAITLNHPTHNYDKNSSIKYAEIIKNVYEGLKELGEAD